MQNRDTNIVNTYKNLPLNTMELIITGKTKGIINSKEKVEIFEV